MAGSTPHQRLHIRCLLAELEIASLFVTEKLLAYSNSAGITNWSVGQRVDDLLRNLDGDKARGLAKALIGPEQVPA
ncbi:hypothetical protein [Pinirhizobacter sp.]|jgi:hypothetical protein|uniref:hypothetical protein n=1 Tax=Pinirhizobacter sp. TaxID=2950432 RepID=UPI002F406D6C